MGCLSRLEPDLSSEDGAFIGSRSIVVEGVVIEEEAVLGAGTTITASTPIIDVTGSEEVVYKGRVPARSVVIPGTRPKTFPAGTYNLPCALIIGHRNASTDRKTSLNDVLREFASPSRAIGWTAPLPWTWGACGGVARCSRAHPGLMEQSRGYESLFDALVMDRSMRMRVAVGGQLDLNITQGELFRFVHTVLHGDMLHVLVNVILALFGLGRIVEPPDWRTLSFLYRVFARCGGHPLVHTFPVCCNPMVHQQVRLHCWGLRCS